LLAVTDISGIIVIDLLSCGASSLALLRVRFPALPATGIKNILTRAALIEGASFICAHPPLLKLQMLFTVLNFLNGMAASLLVAFLLIKTNYHAAHVAIATSIGATGVIIGGFLAAVVKVHIPRVHFMLLCLWISGIAGRALLPYLDSPVLIGGMLMLRSGAVALVNANNDTIWQAKVAPPMQGRVFGTRRVFGQALYPLALLVGGYLHEHILSDKYLSRVACLQYLQFQHASLGLSILFLCTGVLECMAALIGGLSAGLLQVESRVPDHDYVPTEA
jgi:DHA3 family macrolide efflux protein-like MFS transporter